MTDAPPPLLPDTPTVRDSLDADMPAVAEIYTHHVLHGLGSFEEVPPGAEVIARRRAEFAARGLPWLVAAGAADGRLLGYAYASPFRTRSAYRYTVEDSVYVAAGATGRGIGTALLGALVARCTALGYRQMIAVIGDSANAGSIGLHAKLGFVQTGLMPAVGFKFGRWVDSVRMQRALGEGAATPPEGM